MFYLKKMLQIIAYSLIVSLMIWLLMPLTYLFYHNKFVFWMLPTCYTILGYTVFVSVKSICARNVTGIFTVSTAVFNIISVVLIPCDPTLKVSVYFTGLLVLINTVILFKTWKSWDMLTKQANNVVALTVIIIIALSSYFYTSGIFMLYEYGLEVVQ